MRRRSVSRLSKYSGLTLLILSVVLVNDTAAATRQLVQRFGDSALQAFNSRMRNSMTQRFESRMISSPVQDFNSQILSGAIQTFNSRMMDSPAQRIQGPGNPLRFFSWWFYPLYVPVPLLIPTTAEERESPPEPVSKPTAPPLFISLHCGAFAEMTVGESEILSEKEEAPCTTAE